MYIYIVYIIFMSANSLSKDLGQKD
jgi:hypothetical protein